MSRGTKLFFRTILMGKDIHVSNIEMNKCLKYSLSAWLDGISAWAKLNEMLNEALQSVNLA